LKTPCEREKQILSDKDKLSINQISKKYNLPRNEIKNIFKSSHKKTPLWFYAVLILIPIVSVIILEVLLRIIDYGDNYTPWIDVGNGKYMVNPELGKKYFPNVNFNPRTTDDVFDKQKNENAFRVFVLGESSAEGFPFIPAGSFPRYIRKRLELVYPNSQIEVVNVSMTAINSYTLLDLLPSVLEQKPDLVLIYTGHNEYYGSLGVGSTESYGSSRALTRIVLYLDKFKITQFVRNSINWTVSFFVSEKKKPSGILMNYLAKDKFILLNSELFNAGLEQFKENLTDIVQMINDKGVPVILGRLVSNLKDLKPFISINIPGSKSADQVYKEATQELKNNNQKADSLFRLAKDLDALKFRAPEMINKIIDNVGKRFHAATIPLDSIFNSASPDGVVGNNLLVDHLHPNLRGYQLIGKEFYNTMKKLGYLPKNEKETIPFTEQDSLTLADFAFTKLDSTIGTDNIKLLKDNWPFVKNGRSTSELHYDYFTNLLQPKSFIDTVAMEQSMGRLLWGDAHLIAASYYLKKDDIKSYLDHINIMIYQHPMLSDYNSAIKYFYHKKKINVADYTLKRIGIIELYRKNYDDAIGYLTEAYKSDPGDPSILYNLSLAYSKKKDFKSAINIINKCLFESPSYTDARKLKQQILCRAKI
jgi:tetratricopeptide (TPR) repeat protein